jgi:GT2 family glycosyltransferase
MKIGLGLITCNRSEQLQHVLESIPCHKLDEFIIVNDGEKLKINSAEDFELIQHEENKGVAKSKNDAFKYLLDRNCDYIFIMEDDVCILNDNVFERYIKASKVTGLEHLNYVGSSACSKNEDGTRTPTFSIEYPEDITLSFYPNLVACFQFYTKNCLQSIGLMDEHYYNAWEHVEHTWLAGKQGFTTPYPYFCDISDSDVYLASIGCKSVCGDVSDRVVEYANYFKSKYGHYIVETSRLTIGELKYILKNKYNESKSISSRGATYT